MKTILSYLAVAALIITSSFTVNKQQQLNQQQSDNCFSSFRAHRQGKAGVTSAWTVSSNDIVQFIVERSYDGEFFDSVDSVDFNGSSSYKYTDKEIYPGLIYYRIAAVKSDGTTEYSPVETVRIVQHG
jgi:hypothetical protein